MTGTLHANTIQKANGDPVDLTGQSAAKAWSNLNGTGTIAARADFNISSYTDDASGNYRHNISSAMSDANFSVPATGSSSDVIGAVAMSVTPRGLGASVYDCHCEYNNGSYLDFANVFSSVNGSLA
jgi:hypothetical protein